MIHYKSDKTRFVFGVLFIILIYSLYYVFFAENSYSNKVPRKIKHLISFLTTFAIYFVGTIHLGKLKDSWMSSIWHFVHISGLLILTCFGLFDWFIFGLSIRAKGFALSIQEILISPILYVAMGLLNRSLNKNSASLK